MSLPGFSPVVNISFQISSLLPSLSFERDSLDNVNGVKSLTDILQYLQDLQQLIQNLWGGKGVWGERATEAEKRGAEREMGTKDETGRQFLQTLTRKLCHKQRKKDDLSYKQSQIIPKSRYDKF